MSNETTETTETEQDVLARLSPEGRAAVALYLSARGRRAGQAGRGASKRRTPAQCRKAQAAATIARMARKAAKAHETPVN